MPLGTVVFTSLKRKNTNNNNGITTSVQTQEGQRTQKDPGESFVLENTFSSFIAGCTVLKGKSVVFPHFEAQFPF